MMKLIAYENHPADSRVKEMGDTCATVTSRWGTGGGNVPFVQTVAYSVREDAKANTFSATELDVANSIGALQPSPQSHHAQVFVAHAFKVRGGCEGGGKGYLGQDEQAFTISTVQDQQIAVGVDMYNLTTSQNSTQTLRGNGHIDHVGGIMQQMAVRRLTPKECERLQGFPDGYTDIRPKGKDTPDGSRYKALGNSWAVPVVAWIGKRINHAIT
jgi:site-specific DNA-cytosine methylase